MLKCLHIENIAVIERSDLELSEGFNAMTGETGAGKSIIIDSLSAVLGQRTSRELIRNGCDKASVSALFCNFNKYELDFLESSGFPPDENGELLITRTLSASGGGSVRINSRPATVGILRSIGAELVNIHGQHDNQKLLDPAYHSGYVDSLADNEEIKKEYYNEFKRLNAIRRELQQLETDSDEKIRRTEILEYQINELESADIKVGEIEELREKIKLAENSEKMLDALNLARAALGGESDYEGAAALVAQAGKYLGSGGVKKLEGSAARLTEISYELSEINADIESYLSENDFSEENADKLRERLDFLHRLMLKYGNSEEKLLAFLENAKNELKGIKFSDERAAELSEELDKSTERLIVFGEKLTASRKKAAAELERQVTDALKYLDMPQVSFSVELNNGRYTKNGCDELQFLICANAGEEPRPLAKIASGGELSRVMLAIKSILADADGAGTLIFDEIDTGISGHAAIRVGRKLRQVSKRRQVLCVTHLAQIAAAADRQLLIEKRTENGRTFTGVTALNDKQRLGELARIMSGGELTENLLKSAKELLDRSKVDDNL